MHRKVPLSLILLFQYQSNDYHYNTGWIVNKYIDQLQEALTSVATVLKTVLLSSLGRLRRQDLDKDEKPDSPYYSRENVAHRVLTDSRRKTKYSLVLTDYLLQLMHTGKL